MTKDPATFREADVEAVYGELHRCFLTGIWQFSDAHHCLGRGYDDGYRKDDPERLMFSSVYNLAWLNRDIHNGPYRDHPHMRMLLLEVAAKRVAEAVRKGSYQITDIDLKFLDFVERWKDKNGF